MNLVTSMPQFKFLGKLGTGGTAEVSKILTLENKIAALKTIIQSNDISKDEFQKLALREKTLLENINYPGIVKVYEVDANDPCYICLEYCAGKTLEQYNQINNIQSILNILSSIAINLEFLNLKSIIHADIKPDNIFMPEDISLFETSQMTFTKLSDFSLGKFTHEDDSVRAGVGTVGYMAPEVINNGLVSHQSDLFALGVIAYQLLTGQHPFITEDSDPVKINSRVREEEPKNVQEFRNDIPLELVNLINRLLAKDVKNRIQSGWDVCRELRKAGATYQFEKVLNPKYLIDIKTDYDSNKQYFENKKETLDTITYKDNKQLHLIVSDNFYKKNLYYENSKFHFKHLPLTSSYLIRQEFNKFTKASYSDKKNSIENALINSSQNLLSSLLPHLLRTQTIKRVSSRLARKFESEEKHVEATDLYLLAGNIQKVENCGYQAAMFLQKENKTSTAVKLLHKVIRYASLTNRQFDVKSLYMVKGDFLKDLGETDKSFTVYNNLIELYKNRPEDELLAEVYKDLGDLYKTKKQSQQGIKSLEKALEIFTHLGNELEISRTYNNLGNIYKINNDLKTSLPYYRKALKMQKKLQVAEEVASTLNNIGVIHGMTNKFKKALRIFKISLSINKKIGNKGEIARVLNNLGYCYEILGEVKKAEEMLHEAMRYNKEIDSKGEILFNLENLTSIMYSTGQLKGSISYLKEGINLATELNDKSQIASFNIFLGAVLIRLGKIKEGINSFEYTENILREIEDKYLTALLYIEKAQLNIFIDNIEKASELLQRAEDICNEINDNTILIKVLLLKLTISKDANIMKDSEIIINDLGLTKEKSSLLSLKLNYYHSQKDVQKAKSIYLILLESMESINEHINQCQILNTLAKYILSQNNIEQAYTFVNRSVELAKSKSLHFDLFSSLVLYGEILSAQKEFEQCYSVYKQALEIAKNIYIQLQTDDDKNAFQNKKEFLFLVSEIKKLSQIIGQKKEQM